MIRADITIIGAGVTGLAVVAEVLKRFPKWTVILMESNEKFGMETSSRSSEVIHAGIYYPKNSLKALLCVKGKHLLYEFCDNHKVDCSRCGKLIVATKESEINTLHELLKKGSENGVEGLKILDSLEVSRLEPYIKCEAAILSPSTGIVDSHRLMQRLEANAVEKGVLTAYNHEVTAVEKKRDSYSVCYKTPGGGDEKLESSWVINSAGLMSDKIAEFAGIDIDSASYRLYPCKGEYFSIPHSKAKQISCLVYPPPFADMRGLGIHFTKSLDGRARLGPNAVYVEKSDYEVDPQHSNLFYEGVHSFLPFLNPEDLQPDMAGIRPKLQAPGTDLRDFVICHERERGFEHFINLIGIESPGLTSCLSIAEYVCDLIEEE